MFDDDVGRSSGVPDDYRLVTKGYTLFSTLYDEHFDEEGIQVQISSKHFESACDEILKENHIAKNCTQIVREYWPEYNAGRSTRTMFYGRVMVRYPKIFIKF